MRSRDFCYWLQGYFELARSEGGDPVITPKRQKAIEDHLNMVFKHEIDPSFGDDKTREALQTLGHPTRPGEVKLNC